MLTYSESDLIMPALEIIDAYPAGITTTHLLKQLRRRLRPTGEDLVRLTNRHDDRFSQKVRNLKSHDTLERKGFSIFSQDKYKSRLKDTNSLLMHKALNLHCECRDFQIQHAAGLWKRTMMALSSRKAN